MAAAQLFGDDKYAQLDKYTVSMSHPDGMIALMSGGSEVNGHFTAPPFQYQELEKAGVRTLLKSYDVGGGKSTFTLTISSTKWRDQNPKTHDAFVAALNESTDWINRNKRQAAETYIRYVKSTEQLNDPDIEFTLTPKTVARYAEFMHKVGSIKVKPGSWDMAHPNVHKLPGS